MFAVSELALAIRSTLPSAGKKQNHRLRAAVHRCSSGVLVPQIGLIR